jgi:hypothetical protein
MAKQRTYNPAEQAQINTRYPGMEWRDGNPYTKLLVPDTSEDYLGANASPQGPQESMVPAHTTEQNFPWEALALMTAAPALVAGGGALAGAGSGAGAGGSGAAAASYGGLPVAGLGSAPTAGMITSLAAPSVGGAAMGTGAAIKGGMAAKAGTGAKLSTAAKAGTAAVKGGGGVGGFMNSPLGIMLAKAGLDFGAGALSPDPYKPFQFSEVGGEKGRLVNPDNAAYNSLRALMGLGMGVGRKLGSDVDMPPMPGQLPQVNVPGIPFSFGGSGQPASNFASKMPGFDFSLNGEDQLSGFYEKLLTPAPAREVLAPTASSPAKKSKFNRLREGR